MPFDPPISDALMIKELNAASFRLSRAKTDKRKATEGSWVEHWKGLLRQRGFHITGEWVNDGWTFYRAIKDNLTGPTPLITYDFTAEEPSS